MLGYSRARLATSPALGSASICQFPVSNKMDGWRMEIMVETQPQHLCILPSSWPKGEKGRQTQPPRVTSISYHPLSRLLCFKIQIRRGKGDLLSLLPLPSVFNTPRNFFLFMELEFPIPIIRKRKIQFLRLCTSSSRRPYWILSFNNFLFSHECR